MEKIEYEIVLERTRNLILNVVNDTIIHFDERVQLEKNDILENICSFIDFKNCLFQDTTLKSHNAHSIVSFAHVICSLISFNISS